MTKGFARSTPASELNSVTLNAGKIFLKSFFCRPRWECNKCRKLLKREYVNEVMCAARSEIMECGKWNLDYDPT